MQFRHRARPLSGRHSTGECFGSLPIQLSDPEVYLRVVRPEWPYPAAALPAKATARAFVWRLPVITRDGGLGRGCGQVRRPLLF